MSTEINQQFTSHSATSYTHSTREEMDTAIHTLQQHKHTWATLAIPQRIDILKSLSADFARIAPRWIHASQQAKGIHEDSPFVGEDSGSGTLVVITILHQLVQALQAIQTDGYPRIPGKAFTRPDGQVVVPVFPNGSIDKLVHPGVRAEIWMQPDVTLDTLHETQALSYRQHNSTGKVTLVLGAGNVASIAPTDVLYKLFVENQVVLLKMNPINAYLGPLLEEAFQALITPNYLRIVYGDGTEGAYLCQHAEIEEIHITGSDKTFDAIVFGSGTEGQERKASRQPYLHKPITGELGNVSPVIVVPGPWSAQDITYQAEHLVTSLVNNAGFNCNATRVIIQHADWSQRQQLKQHIMHTLSHLPTRPAYYNGAQERHQAFVSAHPEAERFGSTQAPHLPWTFIHDLDAKKTDDICFKTEAFCGVMAETALAADTVEAYIDQAVEFANTHLTGTLNATLLVHPASLKNPVIAQAVERAIANLRYGTVAINYWAGVGFALGTTTWGAFPGYDIYDIQSGNGVVHNTFMFSRPQKSVLRAPFRTAIKPVWFVSQNALARSLTPFIIQWQAAAIHKSFSSLLRVLQQR